MSEHPDLLALDAVRAGEGTPSDASHVDSCAACRSEIEGMRRLGDRLRALPGPIPAGIDRAILRPRRVLRPWPAAAAALLVCVGLVVLLAPRPESSVIAQDIDRNGVVDIRDAYQLAVRIRAGSTEPRWDFNGDGKVDRQDVDAVAQLGVSLAGKGN